MITRRHRHPRTALLGVVLLGLVPMLGCGDIPGDADDTGSVIQVESISGWYLGELTNQVDTTRDICDVDEQGKITWEDFSDHYGVVKVTNRPLPNHDEQTASPVYIRSYTVTYRAIAHADVNPPALEPYRVISLLDTQGIEPCQPNSASCSPTEYSGLKFVDVAKKEEYLREGGGAIYEASYNLQYTFYGENLFGEEFTFGGGTNFTIANYDHCN